jgi:hypothetical protein
LHGTVALLGATVLSLASFGCVGAGDASDARSKETSETKTTSPPAGETTVGERAAEVELKPVGDSTTSGIVVFKKIDTLGVQVDLRLAGLPEKSRSEYYAQVHEGECVGTGADAHDHEHGAVGHPLALVRFDRIAAKAPPEYAHGGHDGHGPPNKLRGNIDQPIAVVGSVDGTASVTTLLEGVTLERIFTGEPKYLDLHAADSEDAPILACADLHHPS